MRFGRPFRWQWCSAPRSRSQKRVRRRAPALPDGSGWLILYARMSRTFSARFSGENGLGEVLKPWLEHTGVASAHSRYGPDMYSTLMRPSRALRYVPRVRGRSYRARPRPGAVDRSRCCSGSDPRSRPLRWPASRMRYPFSRSTTRIRDSNRGLVLHNQNGHFPSTCCEDATTSAVPISWRSVLTGEVDLEGRFPCQVRCKTQIQPPL